MSLVTRTPLALEIGHHDLPNRVGPGHVCPPNRPYGCERCLPQHPHQPIAVGTFSYHRLQMLCGVEPIPFLPPLTGVGLRSTA